MPTLTLSWTDLFLALLTAGIIGGAAIAGSQIRSERSSRLSSGGPKNKPAKAAKKKKSSQAKKNAQSTSQPEDSPRSISLVEISSPALIPEVANNNKKKKKKKSPESLPTEKTSLKKLSPNALDDEQEFPSLGASVSTECSKPGSAPERPEPKPAPRPFAERMQAPARKTKVDDMIDEDVVQPLRMARVMKVVEESSDSSSAGGSDTEDGWEKVSDTRKSRGGAKTMTLKISSTTAGAGVVRPPGSGNTTTAAASKRQRQNAKKKEAAKAAKVAEEAERIARLSTHKRQQEGVRMNEQAAARPTASQSSKSKEVGGGMKASIGGDGKLIWE